MKENQQITLPAIASKEKLKIECVLLTAFSETVSFRKFSVLACFNKAKVFLICLRSFSCWKGELSFVSMTLRKSEIICFI